MEKSRTKLNIENLIYVILLAELLRVEDLENLLHERLLLSFNTEIEDGSIEEVLYFLMAYALLLLVESA